MEPLITIGKLVGLPAAAGLNAYATLLTFGLLLRFHLITDPEYLSPKFQTFASDGVLGIAFVCYILEFLADKIPGVDHVWDAIHSFIRPFVGALLAFYSIGALDPDASYALVALATILGGGVAAATHTTKATVRLVSTKATLGMGNWFLSLFEDAVAIIGSYLAVTHPSLAGALVIIFLVLFVLLFPKILKISHSFMLKLSYGLRALFSGSEKVSPEEVSWIEPIPTKNYQKLQNYLLNGETIHVLLRNIQGALGTGGPGWFIITDRRLILMGKKWFRWQFQDIPHEKIINLGVKQGLLSDSLIIYTPHASEKISLFKDPQRNIKLLVDKLQKIAR
jgi:uncharacterized membrane protein HdeD (DUF308 family)